MKLQQRIQIRPLPVDGTKILVNREGGTENLPVFETSDGVFTSVWMLNKSALKFWKSNKGEVVITLVVDTNVPGHPSVSMMMQKIDIV